MADKMRHRVGKFYIPQKEIYENLKDMTKVFRLLQFVPLRVQFKAEVNQFEYIGNSDLFDNIAKYSEVPVYELEVHYDAPDLEADPKAKPVVDSVYVKRIDS